MKAMVVYESAFGNTKRIAHAVASTLGETVAVGLMAAGEVNPKALEGIDLLVIGCPTQTHGLTANTEALLEDIPHGVLQDKGVAVFDTRFHALRWVTGSAAPVLAKELEQHGARLVVAPESFFVTGYEGPLEHGEVERAADWARTILTRFEVIPE